jgi:hypothetical protein
MIHDHPPLPSKSLPDDFVAFFTAARSLPDPNTGGDRLRSGLIQTTPSDRTIQQ